MNKLRINLLQKVTIIIIDSVLIFYFVKDLATMVHEQGDIVDSIESNIESASVQVHEGTDQLRQVGVRLHFTF